MARVALGPAIGREWNQEGVVRETAARSWCKCRWGQQHHCHGTSGECHLVRNSKQGELELPWKKCLEGLWLPWKKCLEGGLLHRSEFFPGCLLRRLEQLLPWTQILKGCLWRSMLQTDPFWKQRSGTHWWTDESALAGSGMWLQRCVPPWGEEGLVDWCIPPWKRLVD